MGLRDKIMNNILGMKLWVLFEVRKFKSTLSKKSKALDNVTTIIVSILIWRILACGAAVISKNITVERPDMLCNIGDEHECVCNRLLGDMDGKLLPCDSFLEVKKLIVTCIKMRHVNLNARLYSNESYQRYFRRRIANIISSYCEDQPHECSSTNVMNENKNDGSSEKSYIKSSAMLEDDDYEPKYVLENVVILKVTFDERNRTNVYFVVTKSRSVGLLNNAVTVDPTKVKYILSAQIAPLSRVLGGIRITEVKLAEIRKSRPPYSNKSLIIAVTIVGVAFSSCCLIAFIKLFRDQRKKLSKTQTSIQEYDKPSRNYGSCTDKFLLAYDAQNGKPKCKSLNNSTRSKKRKSTTCSLKTSYIAVEAEESEMKKNDEIKRSIKNLFKCDPSQLPRESCEFYSSKKPDYQQNDKIASNFVDDYIYQNHTPQLLNEQKVSAVENLPSVVLISSQTDGYIVEANNNDKKSAQSYKKIDTNETLIAPPMEIERPLSRRGSGESTPEQGAEECGSSREDTPLPLGDELANLTQNKISITRSKCAELYSSSSESEGEESKVYHPLEHYISDSENNDIIETHDDDDNKAATVITFNNVRPYSVNSLASSESDDNNKSQLLEEKMMNRHNYERLQESPIPPTVVNNNEICYN